LLCFKFHSVFEKLKFKKGVNELKKHDVKHVIAVRVKLDEAEASF